MFTGRGYGSRGLQPCKSGDEGRSANEEREQRYNMILKNLLMLNSAIFGDAYGGSYRFATELAQALARRGVNIHFLVANVTGNKSQSEMIDGIYVHRYPQPNMRNSLIQRFIEVSVCRRSSSS